MIFLTSLMTRINFATYLKLHWVKVLIITVLVIIILATLLMFYLGWSSFVKMETFSRRQLLSTMGMYMVIGILQAFIFAGIYMGFHYFFFFGGGMSKMSQQRIKSSTVNVRWEDVIGMQDVKKEAWEIVKLLKDRHLLKAIGGKIIKGTLMVGPPGCGKTYLAKAIASEAGLPFLSAVGSEFIGIYVGVGAERMKSLFKEARVLAQLEGG